MRTRREIVTFKLPPAFVEAHREMIEAIDWTTADRITLDLGWPLNPSIEAVSARSGKVIRPASIKDANIIRRYSETLA